ncbi:MAG: hypothetical protein GXY46_09255 [Actinobacteria bacterium]|nr:hypothetical protein [Actinomycetota bacterium]
MVRGSSQDGDQMTAAGPLSGHVDDWQELAVDYLDGTLDTETRAAIERHLDACPTCAARLRVQRDVIALLEEIPLKEVPLGLEYQIMSKMPALPETGPAEVRRPSGERSGWSRIWQRKIRPWVPATIGVMAVLLAVVGYGLLREDGGDEVARVDATTTVVAYTASAAAVDDGGSEEVLGVELTNAAPSTTAAPTATTTGAAETTTTAAAAETTALPPGVEDTTAQIAAAGIENRETMIASLHEMQTPAYFHLLARDSGDPAVAKRASASVMEQVFALTGLEPLAEDLSPGDPVFAALVPREDAEKFVDLLRSIGTAAELEVVLGMEPPEPAADAVTRLMEHKRDLPVLSAQRTPPPAVSDYTFTTSTTSEPAEGRDTDTPPPDQTGAHVLVVIFVN